MEPDISEDFGCKRQEPGVNHIKVGVVDESRPPPHIKKEEELELPCIKDEEPVHPHIKEEEQLHQLGIKVEKKEEPPYIKEEAKDCIHILPLTGVSLKTEDKGKSEESRRVDSPSSCTNLGLHMTTDVLGDRCRKNEDISEDFGFKREKPEVYHIEVGVVDENCQPPHIKKEEKLELPCIKDQEPEHHHIKEEEQLRLLGIKVEKKEEPPYIKEEAEDCVCILPSTGVSLKTIDKGKSKESRRVVSPSSSGGTDSVRHLTTDTRGDHRGKNGGYDASNELPGTSSVELTEPSASLPSPATSCPASDPPLASTPVLPSAPTPAPSSRINSTRKRKKSVDTAAVLKALLADAEEHQRNHKSKRLHGTEKEIDNYMLLYLRQRLNSPPAPSPPAAPPCKDEDELFMRSMVPALKRLPPDEKKLVKLKMNKILLAAKRDTLNFKDVI